MSNNHHHHHYYHVSISSKGLLLRTDCRCWLMWIALAAARQQRQKRLQRQHRLPCRHQHPHQRVCLQVKSHGCLACEHCRRVRLRVSPHCLDHSCEFEVSVAGVRRCACFVSYCGLDRPERPLKRLLLWSWLPSPRFQLRWVVEGRVNRRVAASDGGMA